MSNLSETAHHEQAKEVIDVCEDLDKGRMFFERFVPRLKSADEEFLKWITEATRTEAVMIAEMGDVKEVMDRLGDAYREALGMMAVERPEVTQLGLELRPRKQADLMVGAEKVLELLEEYGDSLYFYDHSRGLLEDLLAGVERELGEASDAQEAYHSAVAEKAAARERVSELVKTLKSGVRRFYGVRSRHYQRLKDSRFGGWAARKRSAEEAVANADDAGGEE